MNLSNEHVVTCLENLRDLMIWIGSDGRLLHANKAALQFYGYDLATFVTLSIHDLDSNFPKDAWAQHWQCLKRNGSLTVSVQHRTKSGKNYPLEIIDSYQQIAGLEFSVCVIREIAHREDRERRVQLMEFSIDQMLDSVLWIDKNASIVFANDATCRNLGYDHDELLALSIFDIDSQVTHENWPLGWDKLRENKTITFEARHIKKDGHTLPVEVTLNYVRLYDQEINCAFVRDITERKLHEQQLVHMATHDALTGLPNRALLNERIQHAISVAKRNSTRAAVIIVDLDKFKQINDNLGHDYGDKLLKELSERMRSQLRAMDTVARVGGDEFVVVLETLVEPDDCARAAEKLLTVATEPLVIDGETLQAGASVGIALYPDDAKDVSTLLKNADIAMYQSKRAGGNQYCYYKKDLGERISRRAMLTVGLEKAIEQQQLLLYYQPIYDIGSERMVAAEALVRWQHPEKGLLLPGEFIDIAEETGLVVPMGTWVVNEVCRQNAHWLQTGLEVVPLAANLSARQLNTPEMVHIVCGALQRHNLSPDLLSLELTESMVMHDPEGVIIILKKLREFGVSVAIDDFGTGYSSLNYLRQFPINVIKIDRAFIKDIGTDPEEAIIANTIVTLAHGLGCKVLAEGVENSLQRDHMKEQGCDLAQGYFYRRPLSAGQFEELLTGQSACKKSVGG